MDFSPIIFPYEGESYPKYSEAEEQWWFKVEITADNGKGRVKTAT